MAKNLFRLATLLLTIVTFGGFTGCNDTTEDLAIPTVEIKNLESTQEDLSFNLILKDATSYGYACVTVDDFNAKKYTLTIKEGTGTKPVSIVDLTQGTAYIIVAQAYNGSVPSELKTLRTTTPSSIATVTLKDFVSTSDGATLILQGSASASQILYTTYTQIEAANYAELETTDPVYIEWRSKLPWVRLDADPTGNKITLTDMISGDYVLEYYAFAKVLEGDHAFYKFNVMDNTRPYVKTTLLALDSEDGTVRLTQNELCPTYYVGLANRANYLSENVFKAIKANGADYLQTKDYEGSIRKLTEKTFTEWAPKVEVTLWIVPCDAEGKYSEDPKMMIQSIFTIPARTFNGEGTVAAEVLKKDLTSYTMSVKAEKCREYYVYYGLEGAVKENYPVLNNAFIEDVMFAQPVQKTMEQTILVEKLEPNSDYLFCAVGLDSSGKIGKLTQTKIHTDAINFDSPAAVAITATPDTQSAMINFVPAEGCTSVRYLFMTNADYIKNYNGVFKRVESALALNSGLNINTLDVSAGSTNLKVDNLKSNVTHVLFALPITADGKLGAIKKETAVKTKKFDITGTASVTVKVTRVDAVSGGTQKKITFTVEASDNCKEYYVQLMDKSKTFLENDIVEKLLVVSPSDSQVVFDEYGDGFIAKKTIAKTVPTTSDLYIYILCKDKDNKYNNPNETRIEAKK